VPTRNVNPKVGLDRFVAACVKTGRDENASEVVRAGLRALEEREQLHQAKLAALRGALDEGEQSGIAEGGSFARVRTRLGLPGK
jgi:antitoxin ParD1/3/4